MAHGYGRVMDMLVASRQPPPTRQTLGLAVARCVAAGDTSRAWATLGEFHRHYGLQGDLPVYSQLLATYGANAEAAISDAQRWDLHNQLPFMAAATSCLLSGQLQMPGGYTDNALQWLVDRVGGTVGPEHSSTVLGSVAVHHARRANLNMLALALCTAHDQKMDLPPSALLAAVRAYGQAGQIEAMQGLAAMPVLQQEDWAGPVANALLGGMAVAGDEAAMVQQLQHMRACGLGVSRRTQATLANVLRTATPGLASAVGDVVVMHGQTVTARLWAALVEGYGRHGMTADVDRVLGAMESSGAGSDQAYRYAMVAYAKAGHMQGVRGIYGRMYMHGVSASQATHYAAMRCHLALGDWQGLAMHLATLGRMNMRLNPQALGRALASSPDLGGGLQGLSTVLQGQGQAGARDIVGTAMCSAVQQGGTEADVWRVVGALTANGMLQAPRAKDWARVVGVLVGQGRHDVTVRLLGDLRDRDMLSLAVLQPALVGLGRNSGPELRAMWTLAGQAGLHGATWDPVLLRRVAFAQAQAKDADGLLATVRAMQAAGARPPPWAAAGLMLAACSKNSGEGITTALGLLNGVPAPGPRTAYFVCRALASIGQLQQASALFARSQWARWALPALAGTIEGSAEAGRREDVLDAWDILSTHDLARAYRGDVLPVAYALSQLDMQPQLVALWRKLKIAGTVHVVQVWRAAVKAHGRQNHNTAAVAALYLTVTKVVSLDTLIKVRIPPAELTWARVLFSLADRNMCIPMITLLAEMHNTGHSTPPFVQHRCVEALGREGRVDGILFAMRAFRDKDGVAPMHVHHTLLQTCVATGKASTAVRSLTHMCKVGPTPDHTALGLTMQAVLRHGKPGQLLVFSEAMKAHGQGMDDTHLAPVHEALSERLLPLVYQARALNMWLEACVQAGLHVPWPLLANLAWKMGARAGREGHVSLLRIVGAQLHNTPPEDRLPESAHVVLHRMFTDMRRSGDTRSMVQAIATIHSTGQPAHARYYQALWLRLCETCRGPGQVDHMLALIGEWDHTSPDWRKERAAGTDRPLDHVLVEALARTCVERNVPVPQQKLVQQLATAVGVDVDMPATLGTGPRPRVRTQPRGKEHVGQGSRQGSEAPAKGAKK